MFTGAAGGTVTGSAMGGPLYPSYGSSVKRRGSNAVMSQVNGGMSVAGSVPGVSYGKDFEYLLQSQVEAANELSEVALLQLTLTGIAVIDLRSVHTFAPNSPSVNLACGKVVATTTVRTCFILYDVYFKSIYYIKLTATVLSLCALHSGC